MFGIEANAMSPAIENNGSSSRYVCFVGNGHCGKCGVWQVVVVGGWFVIRGTGGSIGMLKAGLSACEHFDAVIILFFEMQLEICHGMLGNWLVLPFANGAMEYARVFKNG